MKRYDVRVTRVYAEVEAESAFEAKQSVLQRLEPLDQLISSAEAFEVGKKRVEYEYTINREVAGLLRKLIDTKAPYMMDGGDESEFYELQEDAEALIKYFEEETK